MSGPDDRDQAQILFSVGADYYPSMTTVMSDFSPMKYTPCVGGSRFGLVNGNPRTHYMATIDSLDATKPSSVFVAGGGRVTTPPEQLMANLPPDL